MDFSADSVSKAWRKVITSGGGKRRVVICRLAAKPPGVLGDKPTALPCPPYVPRGSRRSAHGNVGCRINTRERYSLVRPGQYTPRSADLTAKPPVRMKTDGFASSP